MDLSQMVNTPLVSGTITFSGVWLVHKWHRNTNSLDQKVNVCLTKPIYINHPIPQSQGADRNAFLLKYFQPRFEPPIVSTCTRWHFSGV